MDTMAPSFTRAEYWLLEAAVEECLPIPGLSNGEAAGDVNKSDHYATQADLLDALDRLFTEGLIIGERWADFWNGTRRKVRLTRAEIETELMRQSFFEGGIVTSFGPQAVYYWLTERGGAAWEAFACPNWNLFMDGFSSTTEEEDGSCHGEAICPSRWKLEQYIAGAHWLGYEVDQNAATWETVTPWKATYWKELPMAHRVRFPIVRLSERNPNIPSAYMELRRWYRWRS